MFNRSYLIDLLKNGSKDFRTLAKKMRVPIKHNREFSSFIFDLVKKGEVFTTNDRKYYVPNFIGTIEGNIKVSARGFAFLDIDEESSIFILASNLNTAMDGDVVLVKYFEDPIKHGSLQGIVLSVEKRKKLTFVGRVKKFGESFGIIPFDKRISGRFRFDETLGLKENMEVKVEIISFQSRFNVIKVIKKLGMSSDVSMDILIAIEDADILTEFHPETLQETHTISDHVTKEEIKERKDLRDQLIYTIDGDDTKDFDDAIQVEKLDNGNYKLGIYIADVTHYVKENNPIDKEASSRGTSIYLADRVIPMLPEKLSNGICSLNPGVDRLVIACEIEIDINGNNINVNVFEAVINSKYRLTYKEVNNFKEGNDIWGDKILSASLDNAFKLSNILRNFKNNEGYVDFEIEEAKIIIDQNGKTIDIIPRDRSYSEILIEDFMVRANETIAKFIFDKELSFIYRVHEKPSTDKINSLKNIVKILDIDVDIKSEPSPLEFSKFVNIIKKSRFDDFMKVIMLRTMSKAIYSPENIGHFGLASKFYTHFTSPIRRYPDLMVHRMIREYIFNNNKNLSSHFETILPEIAEHSSTKEQTAVKLERLIADIKKAEFYEQFIGHKFKGTIVSIVKFGMFIEFPNKVNGLVHISTLGSDNYSLDKTGFVLSNGEKSFTIGDHVEVYVSSVDKSDSKIDLMLSDIYEKLKNK